MSRKLEFAAYREKIQAKSGMSDQRFDELVKLGRELKTSYLELRRAAETHRRDGQISKFSLDTELYGENFWYNVAVKVDSIKADPRLFVQCQFERFRPWPYPNNLGTDQALAAYKQRHGDAADIAFAETIVHLATCSVQVQLNHRRTLRDILGEQADLCDRWNRYIRVMQTWTQWNEQYIEAGKNPRKLQALPPQPPRPDPNQQPPDHLNFLFCYCLATQESLHDLASRFQPAAAAFLRAYPQYRKTTLAPFIPKELE